MELVVEGEGELDKTILEQIGDPLVHVIRNSVDHGFEMPEERLAQGKDRCGQLTLRAFHETGSVAIEVTDDGKGLDAAALKRKAVDKGLLSPEAAAAMTSEAAFQLVFLPGLSTAAKVTDVSGRGVGMDVVRSNVRNLQGTIEIRSKQGAGTTLIRLPTSLTDLEGHSARSRRSAVYPATDQHSRYGQTATGSDPSVSGADRRRGPRNDLPPYSTWRTCWD